MKCLEIKRNGKQVAVVGNAGAEPIQGSLFFMEDGRAMVGFSTYVQVNNQHSERRVWNIEPLKYGDDLRIKVIDSDNPDPWTSHSGYGEALSETDPNLACSFCNRAQENVKRLIAGGSACICDECVAQAVQALQTE